MKDKEKNISKSATIWVDEWNDTHITMRLDDMFKVISGKKVTLQVN